METILQTENLCKRRAGFYLDNVSLSLPAGCVMGLVGENGAGKSTLLKALLGVVRPDGGQVSLFGEPFDLSKRDVLERIGAVFDSEQFPEVMTAPQIGKCLAGVYRGWERRTFDGFLKQFSIPGDKPIRKLSKGMKMKVCLAAALSHRAELLLLDEPTEGLDPLARDEFCTMLSDFVSHGSNAVLLSSHIVSDLEKVCDYIAFLHEGRLLLCEEKDRLKERYGVLRCAPEETERYADITAAKRLSPYGAELLVRREGVPVGSALGQAGLEDIFLFLCRGRGGENELGRI